MKNVCFFLMVIALASCSMPDRGTVTVTGVVENPTGTEVEVFYYKDFITNSMEKVVVPLDEHNAFAATLPLKQAEFVYVSIPRRTFMLYLKPGASTHMVLDAADPENIPVVSGDFEKENSFFLSYRILVGQKHTHSDVFSMMQEAEEALEFKAYVEGIYDERMQFLTEHPLYAELDRDFVQHLSLDILYQKYFYLMQYASVLEFLFEPEALPELTDDFFAFLEDENLFSDEHTFSRQYYNFLNHYLRYHMALDADEDDGRSRNLQQFDLAMELFSGNSRDLVLADVVISALSFGDFEEAIGLYRRFSEMRPADDIAAIVGAEYAAHQALAPGQPAPVFTLTDIGGQEVSLEDFLGKVVYLDFWASWCGPCLQQIPHAKQLKERMAGRDDLVFLYISVDTDEQAWRNMVADREIQGVHLNVPGFNHEVPQSYNLKGVPTFYLIGRDGTIADNRPPRPSQEHIDDVLMAALAQ